jgi:hypothetical protein
MQENLLLRGPILSNLKRLYFSSFNMLLNIVLWFASMIKKLRQGMMTKLRYCKEEQKVCHPLNVIFTLSKTGLFNFRVTK